MGRRGISPIFLGPFTSQFYMFHASDNIIDPKTAGGEVSIIATQSEATHLVQGVVSQLCWTEAASGHSKRQRGDCMARGTRIENRRYSPH